LAGLLVAYRLQQAGAAVTVIEARDRAGGRVLSVPQALGTPLTAELGGEAFDTSHVASLSLARELGLPVVDLWTVTPPTAPEYCWFEGQAWDSAALLRDFQLWIGQQASDRQAVHQFLATGQRTPQITALDRLSIADYLAERGASPALQRWVNQAYTIKYGTAATAQSSLNLLSFFPTEADCDHLFGPSDERYYLRGGNDQLPQSLAAALAPNLWLQAPLTALAPDGVGYQATVHHAGVLHTLHCDRVVLTLPFTALRQVALTVPLPSPQRRAIHHLNYNTPTKLITAYRETPWRSRSPLGLTYTDLPLQHCWEASDSLGSPGPGLLVAYPGGPAGLALAQSPLDAATAAVRQDLEGLFPGLRNYHMPGSLRSDWLHDPYSGGAYACYRVGQWSAFYGWEGQRSGPLFFAGEHCSRRYQGYMEGACETAEQVVADLLADLKFTAAAAQQRDRLHHHATLRQQVTSF
jgi:monoamine oxidase